MEHTDRIGNLINEILLFDIQVQFFIGFCILNKSTIRLNFMN